MTKFKQLEKAGLIKAGFKFTKEQLKAIETLSQDEVDAIISAASKLDPGQTLEASSTDLSNRGPLRGIIL